MEDAQEIALTVRRCEAWEPSAAAWLDSARGMASMADLRAQHDAGAVLFAIEGAGQSVGAFLLRVDRVIGGSEGVIVAAAASVDGVDMTAHMVPVIESLFTGCDTIRFHTRSAAVLRKMARQGYRAGEIVAFKKIGKK
jgi:hypothetical protein